MCISCIYIYTCNHQNHDDDDDDKDNNTTMRTISYDDEMHHLYKLHQEVVTRSMSSRFCCKTNTSSPFRYPPKVYQGNLKRVPWNRRLFLDTIIFRFHVKLGECIHHVSISFIPGLGSFCPLVGGLEPQSVAGWR